jgi:hypothetical protein
MKTLMNLRGSIKGEEILDYLSNYRLLKEEFAPWSYTVLSVRVEVAAPMERELLNCDMKRPVAICFTFEIFRHLK